MQREGKIYLSEAFLEDMQHRYLAFYFNNVSIFWMIVVGHRDKKEIKM